MTMREFIRRDRKALDKIIQELMRVEIELAGWIENERLHHEVQKEMLDRLLSVKTLLDNIRKPTL